MSLEVVDLQVSERPSVQTAPRPSFDSRPPVRGRVRVQRRPEPPGWRVPVLCALLVAAFGLLAYAVTVHRDGGGLEGFYSVPVPLPEGKPGDVIKVEQLQPDKINGSLYRIMYHSQSLEA